MSLTLTWSAGKIASSQKRQGHSQKIPPLNIKASLVITSSVVRFPFRTPEYLKINSDSVIKFIIIDSFNFRLFLQSGELALSQIEDTTRQVKCSGRLRIAAAPPLQPSWHDTDDFSKTVTTIKHLMITAPEDELNVSSHCLFMNIDSCYFSSDYSSDHWFAKYVTSKCLWQKALNKFKIRVILRCWGNSSILCQQNSDAL